MKRFRKQTVLILEKVIIITFLKILKTQNLPHNIKNPKWKKSSKHTCKEASNEEKKTEKKL